MFLLLNIYLYTVIKKEISLDLKLPYSSYIVPLPTVTMTGPPPLSTL